MKIENQKIKIPETPKVPEQTEKTEPQKTTEITKTPEIPAKTIAPEKEEKQEIIKKELPKTGSEELNVKTPLSLMKILNHFVSIYY